MPQTKSKSKILVRLETERKRLEKNLARLSEDDMLQTGVVAKSSIKDVLAHLADWEERMPIWIEASRRGDPVACPEPGLTWQQLGLLNERIYKAHREETLDQVREYFRRVHAEFMEMVETMSESEMLTRGRHPFIGTSTVYNWLNAYAAHDLWAKTKIRKWMQARKKLGRKKQ